MTNLKCFEVVVAYVNDYHGVFLYGLNEVTETRGVVCVQAQMQRAAIQIQVRTTLLGVDTLCSH
jgi:hypothetical protein